MRAALRTVTGFILSEAEFGKKTKMVAGQVQKLPNLFCIPVLQQFFTRRTILLLAFAA